MDKKIVVVVILVVMSATIFPVAGLLPTQAGVAKHITQLDQGTFGNSGANDVWPMFRHDAGNTGCSPFDAPSTNHLAWKKQINSEIYGATPILYANKLYISTNWFYKGEPPKMTNPFTAAPPSPLELLQSLLTHQNDTANGLYCLDAKTGEQLWYQPMAAPNDPAIVDDKLYITDMNYYGYYSSLYCLNATTGNIIWQKSISSTVLSQTIVADQKIFLGCLDLYSYAGSVKCYDLQGNLLWNRALSGYETLWFSAPAYSTGRVYFITTNLYSYYSGKLYCLNAANGQILWTHPVFSFGAYFFETPSAVCADAKVFVSDFNMNTYEGVLKCYDAVTGSTIWMCNLGSVLSFSSPAVCQDSVYVTGSDLYTYTNWLYRINETNGNYLWRVSAPASSYFGFGSLVCSADKIIMTPGTLYGYSNDIYCYERLDGAFDWQFTTDSYILGHSSIGDGRLYTADEIGNIYAFEDILKIQAVSGGLFGVNAQIQNTGNTSIANINWSISVVGGHLGLINRARSGTIQELQAGSSRMVRLIPIIGMGDVTIVVTATMPGINIIKKVKQGTVLGTICVISS